MGFKSFGAAFVALGLAAGLPLAAAAQPVSFAVAQLPRTGAIAVPVATRGVLAGEALGADQAAGGAIGRAIAAADFTGNVGSTLTLYGVGPYARVVLIGTGDQPLTRTGLEDFGGRAAIAVAAGRAEPLAVAVPAAAAGVTNPAALVALGARLGSYSFPKVGTQPQTGDERSLVLHTAGADAARQSWSREWQAVAEGVALARDLISTPSNIKSPQWFVDRTRAAFEGLPVEITVIDEQQAARLGMGGLVGVGQGSTRPPRLMAVSYRGGGTAAPIAFVGKGITFDSGGISLKDPEGMWRMRYDMSGAAASMGAVLAAARRGARANVVAVAALAENMPDGNAIRPGDVLTALDGHTMEILNTDAEGRVVLADANVYAARTFSPALLVNIATLTGAARGALGDDYAALFSRTDAAAARVAGAGEAVGEATWRLPIHASVYDDLRSDVATVKNVVEGGAPGASIGAAFLEVFVPDTTEWVHLDIAGMAWRTARTPTVPAGAVGYGVRLFDELVRRSETR
jgi:leucyl aminopeptidase